MLFRSRQTDSSDRKFLQKFMRDPTRHRPLEGIRENLITYSLREIPVDAIMVWEDAQSRKLNSAGIDSPAPRGRRDCRIPR